MTSDERIPLATGIAGSLYLCHIVCEAWTSSSEGFLALALIAAGIALARREIRIPASPLFGPLALFVAGSLVATVLSYDPLRSLREMGGLFTILTLPLALALCSRDPAMVRKIFAAVVFLAVLLSVWGAFEYFVLGYDDLEHRISGPAAHVMTLSGILIAVSLVIFVRAWTRRSAGLAIVCGMTLMTLVLTFTRGAWIGWLFGAASFVVVRRTRWVFWAMPVVILAIVFSPAAVFDRGVSALSMTQASNLDRVRMIEGGIEMIRDHPFSGVGPGNIKEIYPLYRSEDAPRFRIPHLHNNVVQIWAERGFVTLLGYTGFLAVLLWTFVPGALRGESWAQGGLAVTVGLTVAGLFEYNFGDSEVMMTFLDLVALCASGMAAERIRAGSVLLGGPTVAGAGVPAP